VASVAQLPTATDKLKQASIAAASPV